MIEGRIVYNPTSPAETVINASSRSHFPPKPSLRISNPSRTGDKHRGYSIQLPNSTWVRQLASSTKWEFEQLQLSGYSQPSRDSVALRSHSCFCHMGLCSPQCSTTRPQSISFSRRSHWSDVHLHPGSRGDATLGMYGVAGCKRTHSENGRQMCVSSKLRQLLSLTSITYAVPTKEWTMTHSFYVVMGGFALHDKKEDILRPVHPSQFIDRLMAGEFLFPKMSAEEIADKSKGDGLTKSIAIVQILWFATQLISRFVVGWAAADVEVLTLGTCVVMLLVYGFWLHKPLSVHCQTELEPGPGSTDFRSIPELQVAIVLQSRTGQRQDSKIRKCLLSSLLTLFLDLPIMYTASKTSFFKKLFRSKRQPRHWVHELVAWRLPESDTMVPESERWNPLRILRLFPIIVVFPFWLLLGFMHPILHGMASVHPVDEWEDSANPVGPPKFFNKPLLRGHLVLLGGCAVFSSLHFISSNSHTSYTSPGSIPPNHFESMFFFSFCSTMMVCGPLLILFFVWVYWITKFKSHGIPLAEAYTKMSRWTAIFLLVHASLRLVVVLLSLFLLSRLPQSAFRELSWADVIPFI